MADLTDDEFALLREADEAGVRALATLDQRAITESRMRLIATVERIVADRERAARAEALREVEGLLPGLAWGDYFNRDGELRYGASVLPEPWATRSVGLDEVLRAMIRDTEEADQ